MSDDQLHILFSNGAEILDSARRRMLPLEPGFGVALLQEAGWKVTPDEDSVFASRFDAMTKTSCFLSLSAFEASPLRLCCLVREYDLGKLAGELRECRTLDSSDGHQRVEYVSMLPWPFAPRWLHAKMRFGVVRQTGAMVVLGESEAEARPPPGAAAEHGVVHYSYYHISSGDAPGTSVLTRIINIDMRLPLPDFVVRMALAPYFRSDMVAVAATLAGWDASPLRQRLESNGCYRALERALEVVVAARKAEEAQVPSIATITGIIMEETEPKGKAGASAKDKR